MFSLMDKVPSGIEPMLKDLEEHIMSAGLADMVASAETITSVSDADQRGELMRKTVETVMMMMSPGLTSSHLAFSFFRCLSDYTGLNQFFIILPPTLNH